MSPENFKSWFFGFNSRIHKNPTPSEWITILKAVRQLPGPDFDDFGNFISEDYYEDNFHD